MAMVKEVVVLIEGEAVVKTMIEQGETVIVVLEVEVAETIERTIIMNQMIRMLRPNKKTIHLQKWIQRLRMTH